ncbi:WRKY transcription factor 28-like [Lotus japonicus]|uniref:WRKY transcription factor 28-like n=1 Tax=Lotus japonicus TaxID=34305 RepID=UPI002585C9AC|nr:WRKY transcription factor 28-like [Lotus japonicus]
MADYWGDLYAIFQDPPPPTTTTSTTTNTTPPCLASFTFNENYNKAFSFPNILQQPLIITSCLYRSVPPPPINTNITPPSSDSFTYDAGYNEPFSFPIDTNTTLPSLTSFNNEPFSFPINTNTTLPSLTSFNNEPFSFPINTNTTLPSLTSFNNETFSFPINTNTTPPSLASLTFNEEPLIITDEYVDELDQMLASTTTSTTTTSSNNGIILNPNSLPDFAGQSHHLPPNPVLLAPPSKEPRPHMQKQQKQVFQVETSRELAKGRKSEQKKKVLHVTEDDKLSSDSWAWRKYGQKSIKGAPNPRENKQMETVFYDELPPSDKWTWRKYGTKSIKGTPHPRNYYKCSSFKNCTARKWVQRSSSEAHKFIITYKGEHSHQEEAVFLLPSPFF